MGTELVEQVALVMDGDKPMEMLQIPMRKGLQLLGKAEKPLWNQKCSNYTTDEL